MAYDSYYKRDKSESADSKKDDKKEPKEKEVTISLSGPLTLWIGLLIIATLIQLVGVPIASFVKLGFINNYLNEFADYLLYIPGLLVIPLIVAVWMGELLSYVSEKSSVIAYRSLINSLYASMIYVVSITIIYIIMMVQKAGVLWALSPVVFAEQLLLIPFLITLIIVPLFAILSAARRHA